MIKELSGIQSGGSTDQEKKSNMKKLIILLTVLVAFGGIQLSAQTVFADPESDWLSHKIVQVQSLQKDSTQLAGNLSDCDSTRMALQDKFDTMHFKYQAAALEGSKCEADYIDLGKKHKKVIRQNSTLKKVLLITLPITILEGALLYYSIRGK